MLNLLLKRRSIRRFQDKPVEQQKIVKLIQAALLAPTSKNRRPWEFVVVDDKGLLNQLSKSKGRNGSFLKDAPLAIAVLANPEISDVWVEDASISAAFIQLMAADLGLGSCWIQIRERFNETGQNAEEFIKEVLTIPDQFRVLAVIALGYSAESISPHKEEELLYHKAYENAFGNALRLD